MPGLSMNHMGTPTFPVHLEDCDWPRPEFVSIATPRASKRILAIITLVLVLVTQAEVSCVHDFD